MEQALQDLEKDFVDECRLTFLARHTTDPDAHLLITQDSPDRVIEAVRQLETGAPQTLGEEAVDALVAMLEHSGATFAGGLTREQAHLLLEGAMCLARDRYLEGIHPPRRDQGRKDDED